VLTKKKIYAKKYRETHKEAISAYAKIYMKAYRKKNRAYFNAWDKTPKGRETIRKWRNSFNGKTSRRASDLKRRIKTSYISRKIVRSIYEDNIKKYGILTCYLCEKPILLGCDTLEHKIPVSRGGGNERENLDVACNLCNTRKYWKTVEEFKCKN